MYEVGRQQFSRAEEDDVQFFPAPEDGKLSVRPEVREFGFRCQKFNLARLL